MDKKTVLITGASSGIGRITAKLFHEKGWNVIATMRTPENENELTKLNNVLVTRLDVQDQKSINEAVHEGTNKFNKIDILVNNAGYGGQGFLEQYTDESIRNMFETNVFGAIRVIRAVLPDMRKRKEGRIINITSGSGLIGLPNMTVYCATKFALHGLTEALSYDMQLFNIQVKTLAPGGFNTDFVSRLDDAYESGNEELQKYSKDLHTHLWENSVKNMGDGEFADPQIAADKIFECATEDTPVHNVIGKDVEGLMAMKNSLSQQEFIDKMSELLLPKMDIKV